MDAWEHVDTGHSGAEVTRRGEVFRKRTPDAALEVSTLEWLKRAGLPAAEVLDAGEGWLMTRAIVGRSAAELWPAPLRERVVDAVVEFTGRLHSLPVEECPFNRRLQVVLPEARNRAIQGLVDVERLDPERAGWTALDLLEELDALAPEMRERESPVVTHGDWCLPNVLLAEDAGEVVGVIDTARLGFADRYADLALMSRSLASQRLNPQFGEWAALRFLDRCGHSESNDDQMAFYRLLDEFF